MTVPKRENIQIHYVLQGGEYQAEASSLMAMGATFGYLYYTAQQNMANIKRADFNMRSIWEHEWVTTTKSDGKLAAFSVRTKLHTLLVPRDALLGRSSNAIYLYSKAPPNGKPEWVYVAVLELQGCRGGLCEKSPEAAPY